MEQIAEVKTIDPDGIAHVIRLQDASCRGNCALCGGCQTSETIPAYNDIHAQPGDRVVLQPDGKVARKTAWMLYTIPTSLLLAGYLLGETLLSKGGLFGILGAVVGLWIVMLQDRKNTKKHPITYHITGFAEDPTA